MTMQYLQATSASKDHLIYHGRTGNNRMLLDIARLLKLREFPYFDYSITLSEIASLADVAFSVASVKQMEELGLRVFLLGAKYVMVT